MKQMQDMNYLTPCILWSFTNPAAALRSAVVRHVLVNYYLRIDALHILLESLACLLRSGAAACQ